MTVCMCFSCTACIVVHSALEELSKKKAEKTGPFARPKMLVVQLPNINYYYYTLPTVQL